MDSIPADLESVILRWARKLARSAKARDPGLDMPSLVEDLAQIGRIRVLNLKHTKVPYVAAAVRNAMIDEVRHMFRSRRYEPGFCEYCDQQARKRGMCPLHYERYFKLGWRGETMLLLKQHGGRKPNPQIDNPLFFSGRALRRVMNGNF